METKDMKLTIGHLYPDLLNLYGDRGNIACLMKRCIWRGIEAETIEFNTGDQDRFFKTGYRFAGRRFRQGTGNRV